MYSDVFVLIGACVQLPPLAARMKFLQSDHEALSRLSVAMTKFGCLTEPMMMVAGDTAPVRAMRSYRFVKDVLCAACPSAVMKAAASLNKEDLAVVSWCNGPGTGGGGLVTGT